MTIPEDVKTRRITPELAKRALGQVLIVVFIGAALGLAASAQHRADSFQQKATQLEGRIESSCAVINMPPGDACRVEIRRLRDEALRREGATLASTAPPAAPPETRPETRNAPSPSRDAERDRIRSCLRDINRVLDGEATRATSCRRA